MCKEAWKELSAEEKKEFAEKHEDELKEKKEEKLNAPKKEKKPRALSAYILYSNSHREEMKKKYPGMTRMNE